MPQSVGYQSPPPPSAIRSPPSGIPRRHLVLPGRGLREFPSPTNHKPFPPTSRPSCARSSPASRCTSTCPMATGIPRPPATEGKSLPDPQCLFHHIKTMSPGAAITGRVCVATKGQKKPRLPSSIGRLERLGRQSIPHTMTDRCRPHSTCKELKLPVFYPISSWKAALSISTAKARFLTTESCLLNNNRNQSSPKNQIEQYLTDFYGQKQVALAGRGSPATTPTATSMIWPLHQSHYHRDRNRGRSQRRELQNP